MKRKVKRPFDNEQFRKGYVAGIFAAEKELNTELLHFAEKAHKIMSEGTFPDYGVKINFKDSNNTITTNLDMKTEQKAKAYDEALKKARKRIATEPQDHTDAILKDIFPELKESEDERIRKAIVELVKRTPSSMFDADTEFNWIGASHDEILAYLEKQKEQKPLEFLSKEKVFAIMNKLTSLSFCVPLGNDEEKKIHEITCDVRSLLDYPIEQKPAEWSEEDEEMIEGIIGDLCALKDWIIKYDTNWLANPVLKNIDKRIAWLKSLKDRGNFPKSNTNSPSEWSEDDEKLRKNIIWLLEIHPSYRNEVDWLKSLRPQSHWKPSEEQMEALSETIAFAPDTFKPKCTLVTLQDDLKNL